MAVQQMDEVLQLPAELVEKWSGIAVDIGKQGLIKNHERGRGSTWNFIGLQPKR